MRKLFSYFQYRCICSTAEQAIDFINNVSGLTCSKTTADILSRLFAGEEVAELPNGVGNLNVIGCAYKRVKIENALADSLNLHDTMYNSLAETNKREQHNEAVEDMMKRMNDLYEEKKGWYSASIIFKRVTFDGVIFDYKGAEFTECLVANSGIDAYNKVVQGLRTGIGAVNDAIFPLPISPEYNFKFLGEQKNNEEWREMAHEKPIEKIEGAIK